MGLRFGFGKEILSFGKMVQNSVIFWIFSLQKFDVRFCQDRPSAKLTKSNTVMLVQQHVSSEQSNVQAMHILCNCWQNLQNKFGFCAVLNAHRAKKGGKYDNQKICDCMFFEKKIQALFEIW